MDQATGIATVLYEFTKILSQTTAKVDIGEEFDVDKRLGAGSFGIVVRARHLESGEMMALKLMLKNRTKKKVFLRELSISLLLSSHPCIIRTTRLSCYTSYHYVVVQELAPAGDLYTLLKPQVGLSEDMVKRVAKQLASALEFMHSQSLVHRDLKPDNVLLMDSECHSVKLGDFGLARLEGSITTCGRRATPYLAPEYTSLMERETLVVEPSLDVWALGILIFVLLTGHHPWAQALASDAQYKAFKNWLKYANDAFMPPLWQKFTSPGRQMFCKLLAINTSRRIQAQGVLRFLSAPWKLPELGSRLQDIPTRSIQTRGSVSGGGEPELTITMALDQF